MGMELRNDSKFYDHEIIPRAEQSLEGRRRDLLRIDDHHVSGRRSYTWGYDVRASWPVEMRIHRGSESINNVEGS